MYRSFVVEISFIINHTHGFIIYNNCFLLSDLELMAYH